MESLVAVGRQLLRYISISALSRDLSYGAILKRALPFLSIEHQRERAHVLSVRRRLVTYTLAFIEWVSISNDMKTK